MIGHRSCRFPAALAPVPLLALFLVLALAPSHAAAAECPSFPKVPWWSGLSHDSVARYVDEKYGGDWEGYTKAWDRRLVKLQEIQLRGSAAVIRSRAAPGGKVRLEGSKLDSYVDTVRRRLAITRCLSRRTMGRR